MIETVYAENADQCAGYYKVTFLVNATRTRLTKSFDSLHLARQFANKLRYSRRCTLISCMNFK